VRIVLDTNILISALLWDGTPHRLLAVIRDRPDIRLYSSPALLEELRDVLRRPFAEQRLAKIGKTAWQVMEDYALVVELVEPAAVPRVVTGDADDDQVIAAAVEAGADLIVSGDRKHLLPLGAHQGIPIVAALHAIILLGEP
jgi:uncharacterized protein